MLENVIELSRKCRLLLGRELEPRKQRDMVKLHRCQRHAAQLT
jgi:hypothetical protein